MTGFLGLLARVELGAVGARTPVLAAHRSLPALVHRKKVLSNELDATLITGSWRRLVFGNPELLAGVADHRAYTFSVLEQLHRGLRHREVYARGGDRWGDPRARLLAGERWEQAKPRVLTALDLPAEPEAHLQALSVTLADAYRQVATEIAGANGKAVLENGKIRLDRLGPAHDPPDLDNERQQPQAVMPRADIPDVLLEIFARTGGVDCFPHISGATTRMDDLDVSVCAVLLAEAANIGLTPVVNPAVRTLTRGRLRHVDAAYERVETMRAFNARLIETQAGIPIVEHWGGGLAVSVDGLRFVVPVKSLWAGPNPRYFGLRHRGATWLNVVNDQVMGISGLVVPGTPRDSLFILDAIHNRDGGPKPEVVITDTASYSDIVFGLFAICGYQFSPLLADITDTRLWRIDPAASYGPFDQRSRHRIQLARILAHWPDMLRVAGSLTTGAVRAYDLIRPSSDRRARVAERTSLRTVVLTTAPSCSSSAGMMTPRRSPSGVRRRPGLGRSARSLTAATGGRRSRSRSDPAQPSQRAGSGSSAAARTHAGECRAAATSAGRRPAGSRAHRSLSSQPPRPTQP